MIINRQTLGDLFTGFSTAFNQGLMQAAPGGYEPIVFDARSTGRENVYPFLGQMPSMREWIGDRVIKNLEQHDYRIKNRDFEMTVSVDRNDIEDDQYGVYSPMFTGMGEAINPWLSELVFKTLKEGFAAPCYDGQYFFDTDHPVRNADGTTSSVSNMQAGSGPAWYLMDASKPLKPLILQRRKQPKLTRLDKEDDENVFMQKKFIYGTDARGAAGYGMWQCAFGSKADLTPENYEAARVALSEIKGDEGRPLGIMPTHLVFPPALEGAALRLLNRAEVGGSTNEWFNTATPIKSSWLT